MATLYCGSTKWTAMTAWAALTAYNVGDLRRQLAAPTAGNERAFRCTTAGTSGAAEPTWTLTAGATTNDATAVWTEVTGDATYNSGGTWAAPHARLRSAMGRGVAGDQIRVHSSHAATEAAGVTYVSAGTAASPLTVICVNDGDTARATTATEAVTGVANMQFGTSSASSNSYFYGIAFLCGSGNNTGSINIMPNGSSPFNQWQKFEACNLTLNNTGTSSRLQIGSTTNGRGKSACELVNTTMTFGSTSQFVILDTNVTWKGTASAIGGATFPTVLFHLGEDFGNAGGTTVLEGVDLSALGSGKSIVTLSLNGPYSIRLFDCKLGGSVTLATGASVGPGGNDLEAVNCDSADTNYRYYRINYQGTESHETTIVRSGGASDGVTTVSRKIVTTANAKGISPYESRGVVFWNDTIGSSITISIPVVTDNVTLTDAEAWLEVEYLGTSGFPLGSYTTDRLADPVYGTPAGQTTDGTSSWTTTGLTTPVKQTLDVTVTPQEKGLVRARVVLGKASTTMYYDPKGLSTSGLQYQSAGGVSNEIPAAAAASGGFSVGIFGG